MREKNDRPPEGAGGQYGAAGWQVSYALAGVRQPGEQEPGAESASATESFDEQAGAGRVVPGSHDPREQAVPQSNSGAVRKRGNRIGIAVVIGMVAAVAVVVGVTVSTRSPDRAASAASSAPSSQAEKTLSADATTTEAVVGGYQGVAVPFFGIGYDIPAGWVIEPARTTWTIGGFTGRGQADEGAHYCPGSGFRAVATLTDSGQGDPAQAATAVGTTAAQTSYDGSGGGIASPAVELTTRSGITGQYVETSGRWTPGLPGCSTTAFSVYTFAFHGRSGAVLVLAVLADRGTAEELTPDQAREILTSVRELR